MDIYELYHRLIAAADRVAGGLELECRTDPGYRLLRDAPVLHSQVTCLAAGKREYVLRLWMETGSARCLVPGTAQDSAGPPPPVLMDRLGELASHVCGEINREWPGDDLEPARPVSRVTREGELTRSESKQAIVTLFAAEAPIIISLELPEKKN